MKITSSMGIAQFPMDGETTRGILAAADHAAHPSKETRRITSAAESGEEFVGIEVLTPAFHDGMASVLDYLDPDLAIGEFFNSCLVERLSDMLCYLLRQRLICVSATKT